MKTIKSLFYSTFYPFIPADKRDYAEHCTAGGMIFTVLMVLFVYLIIKFI